MNVLEAITEAQKKLRSTQENWQEECLFACDDILSGAIHALEAEGADVCAEVQLKEFPG